MITAKPNAKICRIVCVVVKPIGIQNGVLQSVPSSRPYPPSFSDKDPVTMTVESEESMAY